MAVINDLIDRISDPELRRRINDEVVRLQQQKKYTKQLREYNKLKGTTVTGTCLIVPSTL